MMPLSPPTAPKTVIMTPAMIHAQEAQKCQFVIFGFLTNSQKIEGREYVVGPNPRAPMNPSRSAAKCQNQCKACSNCCLAAQCVTQSMRHKELWMHWQDCWQIEGCSTFADNIKQACTMVYRHCSPVLLHTIPVQSSSCCTQHKDAAYNTRMLHTTQGYNTRMHQWVFYKIMLQAFLARTAEEGQSYGYETN